MYYLRFLVLLKKITKIITNIKLTTCMNNRHVSRQLMAFKLNELEKISKMYMRSSNNTNSSSTDKHNLMRALWNSMNL